MLAICVYSQASASILAPTARESPSAVGRTRGIRYRTNPIGESVNTFRAYNWGCCQTYPAERGRTHGQCVAARLLRHWRHRREDVAYLATGVLGMQVIPGDDRSTSYLRMDEYHHRVELRSNASDDLDFTGWEVPDQNTLQQLAQQFEDGGVKVVAGTQHEADTAA